MSAKLKVGAAKADITPKIGAILQGYAPGRPAESINDNLYATAYAFEYRDRRSVIVSLDLCLVSDPLVTKIRKAIEEKTGVPAENTIISTTHTHSGPHTRTMPGRYPPLDTDYIYGKMVTGIAQASYDAVQSLRPALVGIGATDSDVGINRRGIAKDGTVVLGQNPYGSKDPIMTVVSFREPDGAIIGNMIHYGCHNTASGINPEITRDWCGVMNDRLEAVSGGITAFFNGCEGDCGPNLPNGSTTGNLQMALELGGRAAIDAVRAWKSIKIWHDDCDMKVITGDIVLPLKPVGTAEEIKKEIEAQGDPETLKGLRRTGYDVLLDRLAFVEAGNKGEDSRALPHSLISIGPVAFVPIPFETFSIITLRLREYSPFAHTLSLSNGNGSLMYFPSQDQLCRGGYEVWMFTSMQLQPFGDDSEQYYINQCTALLEALKENK
ncbi:MAG: hypothetical protein GX633_06330 [Clostridiales bacterium]|jgi:neutral ceramidase|nr:hypothetical protein [Clostridiales bacterium]